MYLGCTAKFGAEGSNPAGATAAIAFICECTIVTTNTRADLSVVIFNWVYSLTYTPLQALYPSECLAYNTRCVVASRCSRPLR